MNILYATDGSEGALQGALFLASLPLREDSQIMVLTVLPERDHDAEAGWAPREAARQVLADVRARLSTHVRHGDPAEAILTMLEECPVDLVVVGSRGRSSFERFFLGSVAERVVRHAACPVLVVRRQHTDFHRVLVAVDGSASSLHAVDWLKKLSLPSECEVRLTTVLPLHESLAHTSVLPLPVDLGGTSQDAMKAAIAKQRQTLTDLQALAFSFDTKGIQTMADVRYGDPARALLELAEESHTDLVVLGAHGHSRVPAAGGWERFLLGSVTEKVMRHAHCSVLAVKQPVEREYGTTAAAGLPEVQGAIA